MRFVSLHAVQSHGQLCFVPHAAAPDGAGDADNPVVAGPFLPDGFPEHQRVPHWESAVELGILDKAGARHDSLLEPSARGHEVLGEEPAQHHARGMGRIGRAGFHGSIRRERRFRQPRADGRSDAASSRISGSCDIVSISSTT